MTKVLDTYSFMDLLKDKKYVPEAVKVETGVQIKFNEIVGFVSTLIKDKTTDYDFMDLLSNNGLVAMNDDWSESHSNDNSATEKVAS